MGIIGWITGLDQANREIERLVKENQHLYAAQQAALRDLDVFREKYRTLIATVASLSKPQTEIELRQTIVRQRREIRRLYRELDARRSG